MANEPRVARQRARWSAIGAAIAIALGAGGIGLVQAAVDSGEKSVIVSVDAKRIVDTREGIGIDRAFTADQPRDVQVTGSIEVVTSTGTEQEVVVPDGATSVLVNVTVVTPSADGFLTLRSGGLTDKPTTSTVNFVAGSIEPNAATVNLSGPGRLSVYVAMAPPTATADVLIDVVGYTVDHNHDDRYYTKADVDAALATAAASSASELDGAVAPKADSADVAAADAVLTAAVQTKANSADVYTQAEVDAAIAAVEIPASGVGFAEEDTAVPLTAGAPVSVVTLDVDAPTDGVVVINAMANITTVSGSTATCGVSTVFDPLAPSQPVPSHTVGIVGGGSTTLASSWSGHLGVSVTAGMTTIDLVCDRSVGGGTATVNLAQITATFSGNQL